MEGVEVSFTEADLRAIAAAYDPESDPAPLVIGHPKVDDPAWGWIERLAVDEAGELVGTPRQVEPSFAETIRAGRYRRISARFYPPDAPSNPKPGNYYLKHVGFLGAQAPAVSGLGTVQFADDGDDLTIINVETEMADKAKNEELSFAERQAELDRREQEFEARQKRIAEAAAKARHDAAISFAEGLVTAGKLKPAGKGLVVGVLDALDAETEVSFAEAGEMTAAAAFRKLLESASPMISFAEELAPERRGTTAAVSFAAPDGAEVDQGDMEFYRRAKAVQAESPGLDWRECVRRARG